MSSKIKKILFFVVFFTAILALSIKYNEVDFDLFSRLIMGKHVFLTGKPMFNDVVSYTPTSIWHDHEWLLSCFMYVVAKYTGFVGLTILKAIFIFLTIVFSGMAIKEYNKHEHQYHYLLYIIFILNLILSQVILSLLRCQFFSFMMLPLWFLMLEKIRNGKTKYAYFMPAIMLLWVNCHGASLAALGILFLFAVGEALNRKPFKIYLILLAVCSLTFLINPWGLDFIKFMYDACFVDRSYIGEWRPSFGPLGINLAVYKIVLAATAICTVIKLIVAVAKFNLSKFDFVKILLYITMALMSAAHIKHVVIFMIVVLIYYYEDFYDFVNFIAIKIKNLLKIDKVKYFDTIKVLIFSSALLVYSIFIFVNTSLIDKLWYSFQENFPVNALKFLQENKIKGKTVATYFQSGYLAYKGYPDIKIFMDGRQEQLYPQNFITLNVDFYMAYNENSLELIKEYRPDIIIVENNWPIVEAENMLNQLGFYKVFDDNNFIIYLTKDKLKFSYRYLNPADVTYFDDIFKTKVLE